MKKVKDFNKLGVSERMRVSESLGAKVAIIFNKARERANKILAPTGYGVNIQVDFYKVEPAKQEEVING